MVLLYYNNSHSSQKVHGILFLFINVLYTFHLLRVVIAGAAYPLSRIVIFVIGVTVDPVSVLVVQAGQAAGRLLAVAEDTYSYSSFCERIWLGELTKSIF